MKYKILGIVILVTIAIQFVPYGKDHSNPPVVAEPKWDSPKTKEYFVRACADCHSHKTKWPWYSNIAPISWLNQYDVEEGREHFNVSMWGVQKKNEGDEAKEEFQEGEMPPWFYIIAHPDAKLSESETKEFMKGLAATFGEEDDED
ncbi:heme-binding domain-containing protein [Sulfurovum sp. XGS-02]|uniref:heme-binding domain-containing protein n=1 Tax=Sulfurovum sp. XGS-02 TaxID=2925411 RepID=UPI002052905D|nr:heme-binding domain-containing protein [Sulfurovum sp. XGS-02]UPT78282.1 heme-binding domain-containing protein [Sulfurovum sp. XGS-02]